MNKTGQPEFYKWQWLGFVGIAFFVLIAYAPSFMHGPRADQIMYLAEVGHKKTWWDLTIGCLDLNRHRQIAPGDEILFRPVVYLFLGTEKYFFGYNFLLWQGVGIALHLAVVWLLLRLLLTMHCGWPAIFFTAFFALLFINMEMVIWHHINSYLIFLACILAVLWRFYAVIDGQGDSLKDYAVMMLWLLLAAFTHEMANIVALGLGAVLWYLKPQRRRWALCFWAVPLFYAGASLINAWVHPFTFTKSLPPAFPTGIGYLCMNWLYAMGAWLYAGLFPGELQWLLAARNMIAPAEVHLIKPVHILYWPTLLAVAAIGTYGLCWFKRVRENIFGPRRFIGVIAFILAVIFAGLIAIGRGREVIMWDLLRVNTYYMYIFWIFMVIGLYAAIDWPLIGVWPQRLLCIFAAGLMVFNAGKLYAANDKQANDNNDILVLVRTVELLIKEHGREPDFSFYVAPRYPGNYIYKEMRRRSDSPIRAYSFIEAIYPQYFTTQNPKYRFLTRPQ